MSVWKATWAEQYRQNIQDFNGSNPFFTHEISVSLLIITPFLTTSRTENMNEILNCLFQFKAQLIPPANSKNGNGGLLSVTLTRLDSDACVGIFLPKLPVTGPQVFSF